MRKHNFFATFLKKINLSLNNLLKKYLNKLKLNNLLKKYLNKLKLNNLLDIVKSNKFFVSVIALIILFLSYLSLPNIYSGVEIQKEFKSQLNDKLNLRFNLSKNPKYDFFPRPHFTYIDSTILENQSEISKIKKLKIYVSLNNLFSLKRFKVKDIILENANFNLNNQNYDFFIKLLDQNFKEGNFSIKDSNIFFRNKDNEVLFINKFINLKYFYDNKKLQNFAISKNEIFNLPYSIKLHNDKIQKKIFSKLNLKFLKLQIENELDYNSDFKNGLAIFNINQKKVILNINFRKINLFFIYLMIWMI